jgi:hypothetical protein
MKSHYNPIKIIDFRGLLLKRVFISEGLRDYYRASFFSIPLLERLNSTQGLFSLLPWLVCLNIPYITLKIKDKGSSVKWGYVSSYIILIKY